MPPEPNTSIEVALATIVQRLDDIVRRIDGYDKKIDMHEVKFDKAIREVEERTRKNEGDILLIKGGLILLAVIWPFISQLIVKMVMP